MFMQATRHTVGALVLLGLLVSGANADMPPDQDVVYKIHDDPNDPNSDVVFSISLTLKATARDGNSVGWKIEKVKFHEIVQGDPDRIWTKSDPNVPSTDGRWWIDHADGDDPQLAEFDDPPELNGIATAKDLNDADLEYYFEGSSYSGGPTWEATAGLDYEFAPVGAPSTFAYADDEPVEIDDEEDPDE